MVKREYSASDTEEEDELLLKNSAAQRPGSGLGPKKTGRPAQTTGQETKSSIHNLPEEEVDHQLVFSTSDSRPGSQKKARVSKNLSKGNGEKAASKSRWNAKEDAIVIGMMEKLIKEGIWPMVKTDGRLVSRTSYGVQYHALMLLKQGVGKGGSSSGNGAKGARVTDRSRRVPRYVGSSENDSDRA